MIHALSTVDVHQFDWDGNRGVSEISDLPLVRLFERIFDGACDCGFKLVNPRSRVEKVMVLKETGPDWWEFEALDKTVLITIFND